MEGRSRAGGEAGGKKPQLSPLHPFRGFDRLSVSGGLELSPSSLLPFSQQLRVPGKGDVLHKYKMVDLALQQGRWVHK